MGLLKKIIGGGANKNDVKIAKLELEKAKIEKVKHDKEVRSSNQIQINNSPYTNQANISLDGYLTYSKINFQMIVQMILKLKNDVIKTSKSMLDIDKNKLSMKEKSQLKKDKKACKTHLEYLYLSKDYLANLMKYATGIVLTQEQTSLIIKFAPYFDGVHVLETEQDEIEDEEDSLKGFINEAKREFKSMLGGSKSNQPTEFYLSEYLDKYYDKKINQLEIPDIDLVIDSFKKTVMIEVQNEKVDQVSPSISDRMNECEHCHAKIPSNVKFCSECGHKVETKSKFCKSCGKTLEPGSKFCPHCGDKV